MNAMKRIPNYNEKENKNVLYCEMVEIFKKAAKDLYVVEEFNFFG